MDVSAPLHALADRWDFSLAMAVLGLCPLLPPSRRRLAEACWPALGFIVRKLGVFVPVCGAISTPDGVFFWSRSALSFYVLLTAGAVLAVYALRRVVDDGERGAALFGMYMVGGFSLPIMSGILLPVDGLCHFYMPLVGLFALPKLVIISPVLVWASWAGFLLECAVQTPRTVHIRRALNRLFAAVVLVSACACLAVQYSPLVRDTALKGSLDAVRAARPRGISADELAKAASTPESEGGPQTVEARQYLRLWRAQFGAISATGINVVEKEVRANELSALAFQVPVSSVVLSRPLVLCMVTVLVLLFVVECVPARRRSMSPSPAFGPRPAPDQTLLGQMLVSLRARSSIWGGISPGWRVLWFWAGFGLTAIGAVGPPVLASVRVSVDTAGDLLFTFAGLFLLPAALAWSWALWVGVFVLPAQELQLAGFTSGDWQGRAGLSRRLVALLGEVADNDNLREQLLHDQPAAVLVSFGLYADEPLRSAALRLVDADTPDTEIARLAEGEFAESRRTAAAHPNCPREVRCQLACDYDTTVRTEALSRLHSLSSFELAGLVRCQHRDTRLFATSQAELTRDQALGMASGDRDREVRRAAMSRLSALTRPELASFITSQRDDVRLFATSQPELTRDRALRMASGDPNPEIRRAAVRRLSRLNRSELPRFIRSHHADVRLFAASQPDVTRTRLMIMASKDRDQEVRCAAMSRLPKLSVDEVRQLFLSRFADVWQFALCQPAITEVQVLDLASRARYNEIWQDIASHRLLPAAIAADLISQHVPRSRYVEDLAAEGYDSSDNYGGTTWIQTRPAEGHHEYDQNDVALARRIIESVASRAPEVLRHLRQGNPELFRAIDGANTQRGQLE
jgi:hypothetical protein